MAPWVAVGAVPSTRAVHFLVVLLPQLSVAVTVISGLQGVPPVTAAVGVMEASQLSEALLWARTSAMAAALSAWQAASAVQSTVRVGAVPSTCAVHFLVVLLPQLSVAVTVISGLQGVPPVTAAVGVIEASQLSEALLWASTSAIAAALSAWQAASAPQSTVRIGSVPLTCAVHFLVAMLPQLSVAVTVISGLQGVPPVTAAVGVIEASQLSEALLWASTSAIAAAL